MDTERLTIRRFAPEDWRDLHEYLSREDVVRYEPYEPFTEEQSKAEAVRRAEDESFWAVCLREDGKLIGNLYLAERDFGTWELGYVFNADYHGGGYAAEAARSVISHIIRTRNARRIAAMCDPLNMPSWKLLERLGFRREGHLRQNVFFKKDASGNPIWKDTYEYALLAAEWKENHYPADSLAVYGRLHGVERMITIKQATETDIPDLERVLQDTVAWLNEIGQPLWGAATVLWSALSKSFAIGDFYIASLDGEPAGCMALIDDDPFFWPDVKPGESLFLHKLAVTKAAKKSGVSDALIDFFKEKGAERGKKTLRLDTHALQKRRY